MLKKRYFTMDGVVVGQMLAEGSRVDFMRDPLGSVTGTVGSNGAVQNTYRFTPLGQTLSKTGTGADPDLLWVGTRGYRHTGLKRSEYYVGGRHYDATGWAVDDG